MFLRNTTLSQVLVSFSRYAGSLNGLVLLESYNKNCICHNFIVKHIKMHIPKFKSLKHMGTNHSDEQIHYDILGALCGAFLDCTPPPPYPQYYAEFC